MAEDVRKCRDCGRNYIPIMGEDRCDVCLLQRDRLLTMLEDTINRHGKRTPSELASLTGFSEREVKKTLRSSHMMAHAVESDETCARCNVRNAQQGSSLCFACRLDLHKALGAAAKTLLDDINARSRNTDDGLKDKSVSSAIDDKRRRTGTHRFDPSPDHRKRYG